MAKKKATKKKTAPKKSVRKKSAARKTAAKKAASRKKTVSNTYERDLSSAADDALATASGHSVNQAADSARQALPDSVEEVLSDWTIYTCNQVLEYVKSRMAGGGQVELDMSAISEMDTSGFQILLASRNYLHQKQGDLTLVNPSEAVREVLQRYRHESDFNIA